MRHTSYRVKVEFKHAIDYVLGFNTEWTDYGQAKSTAQQIQRKMSDVRVTIIEKEVVHRAVDF